MLGCGRCRLAALVNCTGRKQNSMAELVAPLARGVGIHCGGRAANLLGEKSAPAAYSSASAFSKSANASLSCVHSPHRDCLHRDCC